MGLRFLNFEKKSPVTKNGMEKKYSSKCKTFLNFRFAEPKKVFCQKFERKKRSSKKVNFLRFTEMLKFFLF